MVPLSVSGREPGDPQVGGQLARRPHPLTSPEPSCSVPHSPIPQVTRRGSKRDVSVEYLNQSF